MHELGFLGFSLRKGSLKCISLMLTSKTVVKSKYEVESKINNQLIKKG